MPRILIVEDSPTQAERLSLILESEGFEVARAPDGQSGLRLLTSERFDLVLSDILMPGLTGYELCRMAKADPRFKDIPVMLLTALNDPMDIIEGLECGADNFITKPYEPEHLIERIRTMLANRTLRSKKFMIGGVDIVFMGRTFRVTSEKEQILDLLISTFEDVVRTNRELQSSRKELARSNERLEMEVQARTAALRTSEQRFRATFEQAAVGIAHVAPDGRFLRANRKLCEVIGYPAEELLSQRWQDITRPEDLDGERLQGFHKLLANELQNLSIERRSVRKDGSLVWSNLTASAVGEPSGEARYLICVLQDITERKAAEAEVYRLNEYLERRVAQRTEALENANRELEAFSYSISHDLRAPLRIISGFSDIVLEESGPGLDPEARRRVQAIRNHARKMGLLIEDLLAFSRSSRQSLATRAVRTTALVREALEELSAEMRDRNVEVSVAELPDCECDSALLRQVYVNLLSNALKFTRKREAARIEVGWREEAGRPVYFVRDNGVGFDMQHAEKLFGVFQRLHPAEDFEGTGVGLAIVENIVKRHGGRVWAEGATDQGATFSFSLGSP